MRERPRLGRGLEEVSSHFLSPQRPRDLQPDNPPPSAVENRTIGVCHPDSRLIQSCLVTNLALELAKRRHPVTVQDFLPPGEASIRTLMGTIATQDEQLPDQAAIKLYGLPEITIIQSGPAQTWKVPAPVPETMPSEGPRPGDHLVNMVGDLDFILSSDAVRDFILITQTGDDHMLKAYAFLKTMHSAHDQTRLHLVMDDAPGPEEAERLFNRFGAFVRKHLGVGVGFLGNLIQDELLQRSIVERRPLVLARDRGETGMASICARLLDTLETDGPLPSEAD